MSDALIGVLVGGLIGWVAPLLTLHYGQKRWLFELKVAHLKSERNRAETMYERILSQFGEGLVKNSYPSNMTSDLLVFCPSEVVEIFKKFMMEKNKTEEACKGAYLELAAAMKRDLRTRDSEIMELLKAR